MNQLDFYSYTFKGCVVAFLAFLGSVLPARDYIKGCVCMCARAYVKST